MGAFVDLTGKCFSRLTVIRQDATDRNKRLQWLCSCVCGGSTVVGGALLVNGSTRSCGCLRRETTSKSGLARVKDLTGKVYDLLTVISRSPDNIRNDAAWVCSCQCGGVAIVRAVELVGGHTRSCGCLRRINITGMQSGWLTALNHVGFTKNRSALWLCQCKCGKTKEVPASQIIKGISVSCGCAQGQKGDALMEPGQRLRANVKGHIRRTRIAGGGGKCTPTEMKWLYQVQKGRCAEPSCRKKIPHRCDYQADHRIAVINNGSSRITNFDLLCLACHAKKGVKHPLDVARENGRLC